MARTADTNRRKTASRRRVIQSIREKYEPKVARTANQKLKGSGVGIFSFSCGNFFIPELKRKSSRATFCGASKQKIVARKRFAGWLSFSVPFSLFGLNSAALSISRARTLIYAVRFFSVAARCISLFRAVLYSLSFRCASTFSELSLGRNSSAYRCRLILLSIRALP